MYTTLQRQSVIVLNWDSEWGGYKKKYNKFTHRIDMGAEHRQMHRRTLALKQEQRVKTKQARATL